MAVSGGCEEGMTFSSTVERNEVGLEMIIIMSVTNTSTTNILLLLHNQVPPTHPPFPHLRLQLGDDGSHRFSRRLHVQTVTIGIQLEEGGVVPPLHLLRSLVSLLHLPSHRKPAPTS